MSIVGAVKALYLLFNCAG